MTQTAEQTAAKTFDTPHRKQITIHTPDEIQAELDELAERRKNLLSLLKVSRRVYGVAEPDGD